MRVDISTLSQGINRLELKGDAESLDLCDDEAVLESPVVVDLSLNVFEDNIKIDGTIRTEVAEECSRCLEPFRRPVDVEIHLYAARGSSGRPGDAGSHEAGDTDSGFLVHDGRQLDLRDEVRSAILLSSPLQPLCRADCKGLCPECGGNLNEGRCSCGGARPDPRWKGLEGLRGEHD